MNRQERRARGERGPTTEEPKYPTVELAYIHPGDVSDAFMSSVVRLRDYELLRTHALIGLRSRRARSGGIAKARNQVTTMFLRSDTDMILMSDSDMGFPPNAYQQLADVIDPVERPVIGGLCFGHRTDGFDVETNAEVFSMMPTLYVWDQNEDEEIVGFRTVIDYQRDALCQVNATGGAFLLIHRSVLERMAEIYGANWFTQIPHPKLVGECFGEDTSFMLRLDAMGVPVFVHTGVRTSHDKGGLFLTEKSYDLQQANPSPEQIAADNAEAELKG